MRLVSGRVLLVLASIALFFGTVTLYVRATILDEREFANRATATLEDSDVRQVVSRRIVDEAIEQGSAELIQAKPLLESAVAAALDTGAFQAIFKQAARNVYTLIFERERGSIVLDLADAGIVVITGLKAIAPNVAKDVPPDVEGALIDLSDRQFATGLLGTADNIRFLGIVLPLLALVLFIGSIAVSSDRRRAVVEAGVAVAIVGGLIVIALIIGRAVVLSNIEDDDSRAAARSAWHSFFGDLRALALGGGALGLVLAATASSVIVRDEVEDWVDRLRRIVTTQPRKPVWRLARALAIAGVSLFVILQPIDALQVAAVIVGGYGLFFGVGELLQVVTPPLKGGIGSRDIDLDLPDVDLPRLSVRAVAMAGTTALVAVAIVFAITSEDEVAPAVERPDRPVTVCNGRAALCARPLNEVVFAGTHNSMSAAEERGLVLRGPPRGHRQAAGLWRSRSPDRHALRDPRQAGQRADRSRTRGHEPGKGRERDRRGGPRRRGASGRPGRLRRARGQERDLHVSHALRAGRHSARGRPPGYPQVPRRPSGRVRDRVHPGRGHAAGHRRRLRSRRPDPLRVRPRA